MKPVYDPNRNVGPETAKTYKEKFDNGFWESFASGANVLDIGYDGGQGCVPLFEHAVGVDLDYPGYDGLHLPFPDRSQDCVYASHVFEHIEDYRTALREWYRVLKVGGFMIICVPHVWFYEKKPDLPSNWNDDHKRFYAPGHLLMEVFESLPHFGYRIRHCIDNDAGWQDGWVKNEEMVVIGDNTRGGKTVSAGTMGHSSGCYEIELVLEKVMVPYWSVIHFKQRRTLGRA